MALPRLKPLGKSASFAALKAVRHPKASLAEQASGGITFKCDNSNSATPDLQRNTNSTKEFHRIPVWIVAGVAT
jgi:hypothetical protein